MSFGVYALALWVVLGLELGLRSVLRVGDTGVAPSFVLPLVVFVGLYAPARVTTVAALVAGLLIDLTSPVTLPGGATAVVPGPNALGMVLAGQLVLGARGLVFLNSPVTLIVLTPLAGVVWQIAVTAAFGARELYDPIGFQAGTQLTQRLMIAAYSAAPAVVLWWPLRRVGSLFGFESAHTGRYTMGRR